METLSVVFRPIPISLLSVMLFAFCAGSYASTPERTTASSGSSGQTHTCKIVTGYGTAIGRGRTLNEAREAARLQCGTALIDQYFAQRRTIAEDVKEDLALACVNKDCS